VHTDLRGETSRPGLFVCGETACTGVHGANRLASNSLLEGLVFGRRIAETLVTRLGDAAPAPSEVAGPSGPGAVVEESARPELQALMSRDVGVLRDGAGLAAAAKGIDELLTRPAAVPGTEAWETTNLLTVAAALVRAATTREETRGAHWRDDFPATDDERWRGNVDLCLDPDGTLRADYRPLPGSAS
jgi:L-aspartate oxidase